LPGLLPHGIPFEVELDRARAIERAVLCASAGDVVLIAGKGHEPYQLIAASAATLTIAPKLAVRSRCGRGGGER